MPSSFRFILIIIAATLITALPASAQWFKLDSAPQADDVTIADLAGEWRIEVANNPDDPFKGSASIPHCGHDCDRNSIMAETITEDKCCGANPKNHARVLQKSLITIENGQIIVTSERIKYLLREEEYPMGYSDDDFELRRLNKDTLVGTANGFTKVVWIRGEAEIS